MSRFTPFPLLASPRLRFEKLSNMHADGIFRLRSNEEVIRYINIEKYTSIVQAEEYIARIDAWLADDQSIVWALHLCETNEFIGTICYWNLSEDGLTAEIGYDLLPEFWGCGYMREAVQTVLKYGFTQQKFTTINAVPDPANERSVKLLQKTGFKPLDKIFIFDHKMFIESFLN